MKLAVVVVRNLSAGWLGAYGNEWVATPNLDRLAAEGIVFERHIAERTDGQPDSYAGDVKRFDDLVPPWDVPGDVFEVYNEEFESLASISEPDMGQIDVNDWIVWDSLRCSYAAVLTRLDAKLGRLFDELQRDAHTIILTSDRGFPLGEHGIVGLAESRPHSECVHLPLLIRLPDLRLAGYRLNTVTQPFDLDTLCRRIRTGSDPMNTPAEELFRFKSMPRDVAISVSQNGWRSIRTDDWTCITPDPSIQSDPTSNSAQLYRWPEDRHEVNDLSERLPEQVEALVQRFS